LVVVINWVGPIARHMPVVLVSWNLLQALESTTLHCSAKMQKNRIRQHDPSQLRH
jgi:hypothetical protein